MSAIICYGQTMGNGWVQELYEAASRHAARRARELREHGYAVTVCALGSQVTPVGRVKMTLLDVRLRDDQSYDLPPVRIERL